MPSKQTTKKSSGSPAGSRPRRGGFPCPECGFVAKHAMGLGRHRSTRHGVVSERQKRRRSSGVWITREQASERAGVHYNTVRQWERSGMLRTEKRPGTRGALISLDDLNKVLAERNGTTRAGAVDDAALAALEEKFTRLIDGLDELLVSLRSSKPSPRKKAAGAKRTTGKASKRATAKTAKRSSKTGAAKRSKPRRSKSKR